MSDAWKPVFENMKQDLVALKAKFALIDWSGGPVSDVGEFMKFVPYVVALVEKHAIAAGGLSGEDKRRLAIEVIDELIKLPGILEWVDDNLAGLIIDWVVAALNKETDSEAPGKSFLDKVWGFIKGLFGK